MRVLVFFDLPVTTNENRSHPIHVRELQACREVVFDHSAHHLLRGLSGADIGQDLPISHTQTHRHRHQRFASRARSPDK